MVDTHRRQTVTQWGTYDAVVVDGRVTEMRPSSEDPAPSPIADGMPSALEDPSRIAQPMIRRGWLDGDPDPNRRRRGSEPFVAVSWDRALDLAAGELDRVRKEYGNEAIYGGSYGWASAGRFHHAQSQIHRFLNYLGGYTASKGSYSVGAMEAILPRVIGGAPMSIWKRGPTWTEITEHGQLVVSFGGMADKNAQVNPGGIGRHELPGRQDACRKAGVEFVNVSPLRGDSHDSLGARWIGIRPNTDVALMLGLAHTLLAEEREDREFLQRCCVGFDRFAAYLTGETDGIAKSADWAARISGVAAEEIVELARAIGDRRTVINVSWSIQRQDHGEQPHWMAVTLAAMSGSMGRPGGGFAAGLGIGIIGQRTTRQPVAAFEQGTNPIESVIPVARIADMLLDPGGAYDFDGKECVYPEIQLIYWAGGNPFHHHQDLNRLVHAWQRPRTVISHDSWWNPLTRFSDIVLPVATTLERDDFAVGDFDDVLLAMHQAVPPAAEARTDYEIFSGLAERLGFAAEFTEGRSGEEWVRELYERTRTTVAAEVELPPFDEFWSDGRVELPVPAAPVSDIVALREDPDRNPLDTPSGKIEIYSATIASFGYEDCAGHPAWMEPAEWLGAASAERFPLHLISHQPRTRLHSQYDNGSHSRGSKVAEREPIRLHPSDAAARGIVDGDVVRLFNDRGACLTGARVDPDLVPGIVVLATGAWYDPVDPGAPDSLDRHGNPNVLTPDRGTSRLAQASSAGSTLVQAERFDGEPPPVLAFEPPQILSASA